MNYTIYNYKGDVINESISSAELEILTQSEEFNCFQWDHNIYESFLEQEYTNIEEELINVRIYKIIEE
jgi:hypothetical protein